MANQDKIDAVAEITEQFKGANAAVITEYRGLSVPQISELRRSLGEGATYSVAKNTLVKRAAAEAGVAAEDVALDAGDVLAVAAQLQADEGQGDFGGAGGGCEPCVGDVHTGQAGAERRDAVAELAGDTLAIADTACFGVRDAAGGNEDHA